jgi:uncharacterized protein (TIGR03067 family)
MKAVVRVLALGLGLWLVGGRGPVAAQPPGQGAVENELARFQGTWRVIEVEENGRKVPADKLREADVTVEIKGDKHTLKSGGQSQGTVTIKLDPTATPKRYDMVLPPGAPNEGKDPKGIYELDGDTWKFCQDKSGKGRPTEFSGKAGSGWVMVVMKREKQQGDKK